MAERMRTARDAVDHLLVGAPDRDEAMAWFERTTGVRPIVGGSHPGMGTQNALVSLGSGQYLELIAPDPAQSAFNFNIDVRKLSGPRLITWAASSTDVDSVAKAAAASGHRVFGPRDGARARPDGSTLRWRSVGVRTHLGAADVDPVPFFIQWAAETRHPSTDSPSGCRLVSLELAHPQPPQLHDTLAALGIEAVVREAPSPALRAVLDTPKGRVEL